MITIYHNPRCKKSREGLEVLKNSGKEFEVRQYLKDQLSEEELEKILKKLEIMPIDLVRTNEKIWKEEFKDQDLSDDQVIKAMLQNPKLIERPIVETDEKAVIGRPASKIEEII